MHPTDANGRISIHKKTERIQHSLRVKDFNTAVNLMISVYEEAFKVLYRRYLGQVQNPRQVIDSLITASASKENGGQGTSNINDLMFGHFIRFIQNSTFIEEVKAIINRDIKFDKHDLMKNISELNKIRCGDTHSKFSSLMFEEYVILQVDHLNLFLKIFDLKADTKLPVEYGTLRTQKITGEIQLYKSLNEVLFKENIDCLDATYFSAKIPQKQQYEDVMIYWDEVNRRVHNQELILRRVISLNNEDIKRVKLLWLMFEQVPKYYAVLGKTVFLKVFNTSRVHQYRTTDKSVNLINMIIMYSKETPNSGHVWIFSSHPEIHVSEREYLHIYGNNISTLRNIFNDLYHNADSCDHSTIKSLISARSRDTVDMVRIKEIVDKIAADKKFGFSKEEIKNIEQVYNGIFHGGEDDADEDEFIF